MLPLPWQILGLAVEAIGKVGADPFGDFVVNAMRERGIGTRGVKRDDEDRNFCDDGDCRSGWREDVLSITLAPMPD